MNKLARLVPLLFILICTVALRPVEAQLQDSSVHQTEANVTITKGPDKLEAILEALRAQTHLDIRAEECLRDRIVMVSLEHVTIDQALLSIAELNNWRVVRREPNQYRLLRQSAPSGPDIKSLQRDLRNALPLDLQSYAGYREKVSLALTDLPLIGKVFAPKGYVDVRQIRDEQRASKQLQLFTEFKSHYGLRKPVRYAKLSDKEREDLLYLVLLSLSREVWQDVFMTRPIPPNLADPRQTVLILAGGTFSYGYVVKKPGGDAFLGDGGAAP